MKNGIIIAIVAVLVGGVVGYFLFSSQTLGATGGKPIAVKYNFTQGLMTNGAIIGGDVNNVTITSTITADQVCNGKVLIGTPAVGAVGTPTYTFPTFALLAAKCLTQNGDSTVLNYINASTATATLFAAGSGGTFLSTDSGASIAAAKAATLTFVRTSASAYKILVTYHDN